MGSSDQVLEGVSDGQPLVAVAATMQSDPQGIMVRKDSPVRSFADLDGHTVAIKAVKTSEIEGELLNRDSVQSSVRHQFGLGPSPGNVPAAERGIATTMVDLYRDYGAPLTDQILLAWHTMLMAGERRLESIGGYRTHAEPMQVVSGPDYRRAVHFEVPPSATVPAEMRRFYTWFNATAPEKSAVDITIQIASLNTPNATLNGELAEPNVFDVGHFPTATFKSTSITKTGPTTGKIGASP